MNKQEFDKMYRVVRKCIAVANDCNMTAAEKDAFYDAIDADLSTIPTTVWVSMHVMHAHKATPINCFRPENYAMRVASYRFEKCAREQGQICVNGIWGPPDLFSEE